MKIDGPFKAGLAALGLTAIFFVVTQIIISNSGGDVYAELGIVILLLFLTFATLGFGLLAIIFSLVRQHYKL